MENIIHLTGVTDENLATIAATIQEWYDDGIISAVSHTTTEENQKMCDAIRQMPSKWFHKGMLWSAVALIAGVGVSAGLDFVSDKIKSKIKR